MVVPRKEVMFRFPSGYEDTSEEGDRIWDEMMPSEISLSFDLWTSEREDGNTDEI